MRSMPTKTVTFRVVKKAAIISIEPVHTISKLYVIRCVDLEVANDNTLYEFSIPFSYIDIIVSRLVYAHSVYDRICCYTRDVSAAGGDITRILFTEIKDGLFRS